MKKTVLFIIELALIIALVGVMIEHQLPVSISIDDYVLKTNSSILCLFVFVFVGMFSIVYKIIEGVYFAPSRIKKNLSYSNQKKGLESIINGLLFLSIGNTKPALREAKKAQKKLPKHAMSNFLSAKSYLSDGNFEKAKKEYRKIVSNEDYMSIGFNGLIEIANIEDRDEDVYTLSKQAVLLDSKNSYALLNLIDCQIENNELVEARANIKIAGKIKIIDKMQTKARLAEIAYVDTVRLQEEGDIKAAIKEIEKYADLDVDYLDLYVDLLLVNNQSRKAKNIVKKEWKKNPFHQTASIWIELGPEDVLKKVNHAKELLQDWNNSHIAFELIAKACIDAEIWGEARDYLSKAIETEEKIGHFLLMAKVERLGFKNHEKHEFWIRKAEKGII